MLSWVSFILVISFLIHIHASHTFDVELKKINLDPQESIYVSLTSTDPADYSDEEWTWFDLFLERNLQEHRFEYVEWLLQNGRCQQYFQKYPDKIKEVIKIAVKDYYFNAFHRGCQSAILGVVIMQCASDTFFNELVDFESYREFISPNFGPPDDREKNRTNCKATVDFFAEAWRTRQFIAPEQTPDDVKMIFCNIANTGEFGEWVVGADQVLENKKSFPTASEIEEDPRQLIMNDNWWFVKDLIEELKEDHFKLENYLSQGRCSPILKYRPELLNINFSDRLFFLFQKFCDWNVLYQALIHVNKVDLANLLDVRTWAPTNTNSHDSFMEKETSYCSTWSKYSLQVLYGGGGGDQGENSSCYLPIPENSLIIGYLLDYTPNSDSFFCFEGASDFESSRLYPLLLTKLSKHPQALHSLQKVQDLHLGTIRCKIRHLSLSQRAGLRQWYEQPSNQEARRFFEDSGYQQTIQDSIGSRNVEPIELPKILVDSDKPLHIDWIFTKVEFGPPPLKSPDFTDRNIHDTIASDPNNSDPWLSFKTFIIILVIVIISLLIGIVVVVLIIRRKNLPPVQSSTNSS